MMRQGKSHLVVGAPMSARRHDVLDDLIERFPNKVAGVYCHRPEREVQMRKRFGGHAMAACVMAMALAAAGASGALAETTLKVGKAMGQAFSFAPLDVGIARGIFQKHGLAIEKFDFAGSARLQQALAAGSIDIGLGSGPEFASVVKGAPATGVGQLGGRPLLLTLIVPKDSPIRSKDDLKGKKVGISTAGSLTQWLVRELSRRQNWGATGIEALALGADTAMIAAMRTKQVDGMVTDIATAYRLEATGDAKIVVKFGEVIEHFIIHVIWARNDTVNQNPDAVRQFLAGWFETIRYMRENKAATVEITAPVMNVTPEIAGRVYDELMPMFSDDGKFDPAGLDVLEASFPELGLLDKKPDLTPYKTEKFLPSAPR
jgi:NitT/TauT family transport system substrate-binding protein